MGRTGRIALLLPGLALLGGLAWWLGERDSVSWAMQDQPCPPEAAEPVPGDWADLCHYQADNARLLASGQPVKVVVFGDSITAWWRQEGAPLYTAGVVNRSIAGQTSAQLVLRFRQDVVQLRPRAVLIQVGLNDIRSNSGLSSPESYLGNVATLIDLAEHHRLVPIIASMPAAGHFSDRPELELTPRVITLNAKLKALAARRGAIYADLHTPLAAPDGSPHPGLTNDGVHPTAAGYAALRQAIDTAIREALSKAGQASRAS